MAKAKVTLKEGFTYHTLDNQAVEVEHGDVFSTDGMSPRERTDRLEAKHIESVSEETPVTVGTDTRTVVKKHKKAAKAGKSEAEPKAESK